MSRSAAGELFAAFAAGVREAAHDRAEGRDDEVQLGKRRCMNCGELARLTDGWCSSCSPEEER